jgi:hypothetical protein
MTYCTIRRLYRNRRGAGRDLRDGIDASCRASFELGIWDDGDDRVCAVEGLFLR